QDEARKELKLCRCVVFHTSKVRSFDTQTYLQVYVYVTLCHGTLQVSRILVTCKILEFSIFERQSHFDRLNDRQKGYRDPTGIQ
ncbi:MAG: hypothetical protein SPH36_05970, partial [Candidatus Cryptobacteroides sp.]|nr:hypothetical protein [Candidatus Cryptobacteroides sp.]